MSMLFWNMDDYPIPAAGGGVEDGLGFIRNNIVEVGHRMGFHGFMEIWVYCSRTGVNNPSPLDMTCYLVHHALSVYGPYGPPDLVVIAKPVKELDRVLECLRLRGHPILLIDPTAITGGGSFFSVESLLGCTQFLTADQYLKDLSSSHLENDTSKILDFFEPIRPVKENRTGVFWDAEDFSFPPFSTPDEIFARIESALVERGLIYKLTIWVYLDDDKKGTCGGGKKEWASRIYFLPGGDKASRRIRMANDIYFWAKDDSENISFEGISILFSDQFKDDAEYSESSDMLQNLVACGTCRILSVSPMDIINKPEESPEWPGLLIDIGREWVSGAWLL
ncbi:unnamed protein product [Eruca vesicaria subsp. sativa]|uniref:NYN domain-containing protein n=1 Tax=Eruca vesicaria subsp. sativa TaxID=29727 RepID=A0ABC8JIB1_ERUVS|nr:unnamed protein product [Eruca vesicaria subsp. sativa]